MATILLDTSVIFDHLNGRAGRTEFLDRLLVEGHLLACCAVNITEVYAGLSARRGDQNRCFPQELGISASNSSDRTPSRPPARELEDQGASLVFHRCVHRGGRLEQCNASSHG